MKDEECFAEFSLDFFQTSELPPMGLLKTAFLCALVGLIFSQILRYALYLDINKAVYGHRPGKCSYVEGIDDGSEDLELVNDDTVIVTSGLRFMPVAESAGTRGKLFSVSLNASQGKYKAQPLKIVDSKLDVEHLNPHGMSSFTSNGVTTLCVINHAPSGDTVEVFEYDKRTPTLRHVKSIRNSFIYAANDLVAVGDGKFYLVNDRLFNHMLLRRAEMFLQLKLGNVVYYDDTIGQAKIVEQFLSVPAGVAFDRRRKLLYVSNASPRSVRVYNVLADNTLNFNTKIELASIPDNLFVSPVTGDLYIGAHAVAYRLLLHMERPKSQVTPSQVLRVRFVSRDDCTITEPFADDGSGLNGSSVAVFHRNLLLIGSINHKMMICAIAA